MFYSLSLQAKVELKLGNNARPILGKILAAQYSHTNVVQLDYKYMHTFVVRCTHCTVLG